MYLWSNGATCKSISNLCEGSFTVTVTDVNTQQQKTKTIKLNKTKVYAITILTKVSCYGQCDGVISIIGKGGNGGPYSYLWSNGDITNTILGICANINYTFTITDKAGCTFVCNKKVSQQPILKSSITTTKNPACDSNCGGTATAQPTGGTPPYNYLWSNGEGKQMVENLCNGTYTVTITDQNGCSVMKTALITGTGGTTFTLPGNNTVEMEFNYNCPPDNCHGYINVVPSPGVQSDYTYLWSNGETTAAIDDLCSGNYDVTVWNASGCSQMESYLIEDHPNTIYGGCSVTNNESFPGAADGALELYIYGWVDNILWSNGQTGTTATGLTAGLYTVTMTNDNGCSNVSTCEIITETICDGNFTLEPYVEMTDCGCRGSVTLYPQADLPSTFTYLWSTGETTSAVHNLCGCGNNWDECPEAYYTVTVWQNGGCEVTETYFIENHGSFVSVYCEIVSNESAPGASDGEINVQIYHGWSPFEFVWTNAQNDTIASGSGGGISGLTAGTYTVTAASAQGCNASCSATIVTESTRKSQTVGNTENKQISVYPNPFKDILNIDVVTDEDLKITIKEINGREIGVYANINRSFVLDTPLKSGVYLFIVENKSGTYRNTMKVVRTE